MTNVLSVEMLRDGGSFLACFQGANGAKYCLHLQHRHELNEKRGFRYDGPVLFESFEFRNDAGNFEWQAINEVEITWQHARVLMKQIGGYLRSEWDARWFTAMCAVVEAEGNIDALPSMGSI